MKVYIVTCDEYPDGNFAGCKVETFVKEVYFSEEKAKEYIGAFAVSDERSFEIHERNVV